MEARLVPLNGLIGLVTPGDVNPAALAQAGFRLVGLEVPVVVQPTAKVIIDALLLHDAEAHLVLCESKSGANVEKEQARRYLSADAAAVVQAAQITLRTRVQPSAEVIYVCLGENVERLAFGLSAANVQAPVLAIHKDKISLESPDAASGLLRRAFDHGPVPLVGPPSRLIAFDHESPADVVEPFVRAELVTLLSYKVPQCSVRTLTERLTPYLPIYGRAAVGRMIRTVGNVVRTIVETDRATFAFDPPMGNRDGIVRFLRTPEDNDPRGRTQAYQALSRRRDTRRAGRVTDPNQLDLLDELERADSNSLEEQPRSEEAP